jgi:hypothetical protein
MNGAGTPRRPTKGQGIGLDEAKLFYTASRERFRPTARHLVPDIVLLALLRDIEENVQAAEIVSASEVPHRGFPNARAAYEAAQRAVLLAAAPDYDFERAKAWVYSLRKDRVYLSLKRSLEFQAAGPRDPESWLIGSLEEMARAWEDLEPGKGVMLQRALSELPSKRPRADNWLGGSIVPVLRDRLNAALKRRGKESRGDTAPIYDAAYGGLSRQSHPITRLDLARILRSQAGELVLEERPRNPAADAKAVLTSAASSMAEGALALNLRLRMDE